MRDAGTFIYRAGRLSTLISHGVAGNRPRLGIIHPNAEPALASAPGYKCFRALLVAETTSTPLASPVAPQYFRPIFERSTALPRRRCVSRSFAVETTRRTIPHCIVIPILTDDNATRW